MAWLSLVIGIALLSIVLVDAFNTTLWIGGGAGPLTARLTKWSWRAVSRLTGPRHSRALTLFGPVSLAATLLLWMILLWIGWLLVFSFDSSAVLAVSDREPADLTARVYFVGYTIFTMGNGDYAPAGGAWHFVTPVMNASGFALVTLAITYILSVLSAVVDKRALASDITSVGETPAQLLAHGWNGRDFSALDLRWNTVSSNLARLAQQHAAYPLLHYYHAGRQADSLPLAIAVLDEARRMIDSAVDSDVRPNPAVLAGVRSSIGSYLNAVPPIFRHPTAEPPPRPDLDALRRLDVPIDEAALNSSMDSAQDERRALHNLVRNEGWDWPT